MSTGVGSAVVEPVTTKTDYAYVRVREQILSGELAPGSVLNQESLAKAIGISTTPLREALRRLEQRGLVELGAHRDARVTNLSAEEARDLLEMRMTLDPLAVRLAAERRTRDDIALMRDALGQLQPLELSDVPGMLAHRRFHASLYQSSHNDLLTQSLDGLWDKADRYRRHGLTVERTDEERAKKAREHALLVELIVSGDADGAAQVMQEHIATSLGAKSAFRLRTPAAS